MVDVTMSMDEYLSLLGGMTMNNSPADSPAEPKRSKKRSTAYQRKYKANFKKIEDNYKVKSGKWAKNGFKRAVKEAHQMSKKK